MTHQNVTKMTDFIVCIIECGSCKVFESLFMINNEIINAYITTLLKTPENT